MVQHEPTYSYESNPLSAGTNYPPNPHVLDDTGHPYEVIQGTPNWETHSKNAGYLNDPRSESITEDGNTNPTSATTASLAPTDSVDGSLSYPTRPSERYSPYANSSDPAVTSGLGLEADSVGGASTSRGLVSEAQSGPQIMYSGNGSGELESRMSEMNLEKDPSQETTYRTPSISRVSSHDRAASPSHYVGGGHIDPVSSGCSLADSNPNDPSSSPAQPGLPVCVMSHDSHPQTANDYLYDAHGQTDRAAGTVTVSSCSDYPVPSATQSKEDELRDRILRLERELKEKDAKIKEQEKPMRWSGPEVVLPLQGSARPLYDPPEHGSALMDSPHHSGVIQQLNPYSGLLPYSPHATIQHQYPQQPPLGDYQVGVCIAVLDIIVVSY